MDDLQSKSSGTDPFCKICEVDEIVEVNDTLRDWSELEVGSKVRGILVDISRVWYKFDGSTEV